MLKFTHQSFDGGIIAITAVMGEQIYVVVGSKRAMVIDTGMGIGSLKTYLDQLLDLPYFVVNTHGHPDHGGGNGEFDEVYLHPEDFELYASMVSVEFRRFDLERILKVSAPVYDEAMIPFMDALLPLADGMSFDLGDRIITTIHIPGHTRGSVAFYDEKTKSLFSGDTITKTDTWLFQPHCESLTRYGESIKKLLNTHPEIRALYPGHLPTPISMETTRSKLECVRRVLSNEEIGIWAETFAGEGLRVEVDGVGIIYDPNHLH
ncbi:MAG TPA: hypothetical protein DEO50_01120 [Erysipelotrichaceae bacterium]|nr:MAG: hypothetical protein A2Y19_05505 [Firmicutes bacterium GWE2_51_13]HBZ40493.1 hypothetical protein [Erysipelotrichaceae bacterium]